MVNNTTILELVERIKEFDPDKIILFGSYANGNATDESDVDLFVVKNLEMGKIRDMRIEMRRSISNIIWDYKIDVDLLLDNEEHINYRISIGDKFYDEIITNGKLLYAKQNISERVA